MSAHQALRSGVQECVLPKQNSQPHCKGAEAQRSSCEVAASGIVRRSAVRGS